MTTIATLADPPYAVRVGATEPGRGHVTALMEALRTAGKHVTTLDAAMVDFTALAGMPRLKTDGGVEIVYSNQFAPTQVLIITNMENAGALATEALLGLGAAPCTAPGAPILESVIFL